jgi:DHA2 family metal-tetracycline-proton antiporter-like MFS transporter
MYIVNISMPSIMRYFNATTSEVAWVVLMYLLFNCGTMLLTGKLADSIGPKRLFIWGYVIFTGGSLLCGMSPTLSMLIISRAVQGLGGAIISVMAYTIVSKFIAEEKIGSAFGILAMATTLGIAIGAPAGGFIVEFVSWHWVFLINVPMGIIAIITASKAIPADSAATKKFDMKALDIYGFILNFAATIFFLLTLNMGKELGWSSLSVLSFITLAIISGILFVKRERSVSSPLLDLSIFKHKNLLMAILCTLFGLMMLGGNSFMMPLFLESGKLLAPNKAGLMIMISSTVLAFCSPFAGRISDKISTSLICRIAMVAAAAVCIYFKCTAAETGFLATVIFLITFAMTYAFFITANNKQVMIFAPADKKGTVSAVFAAVYNYGALIGVCIFETVYSEFSSATDSIANLNAFGDAYSSGIVICAAALLCALLIKKRKTETENVTA